jgi:cell division protein FtsB
MIDRLARGAQSLANQATLVKAQVADLEAANQALAARKKRSKRRIQKQGTLARA